jgi:hypothetical protein
MYNVKEAFTPSAAAANPWMGLLVEESGLVSPSLMTNRPSSFDDTGKVSQLNTQS